MYLKYLVYIIEHKINVGIECLKAGLYIHAITHDLSKFRPSEFIPYARWFYGKQGKDFNGGFAWEFKIHWKLGEEFEMAWNLHQKRNKHHWNFWISIDGKNNFKTISMPPKYIRQMICDWEGMGRKFNDTWIEFYNNNKHKFLLHEETIQRIKELSQQEVDGLTNEKVNG